MMFRYLYCTKYDILTITGLRIFRLKSVIYVFCVGFLQVEYMNIRVVHGRT